MKQIVTFACYGIIVAATTAFSPLPQRTLVHFRAQPNGNKEMSPQEARLEQISQKGASRIAKMGIPERAKRAIMAEQIEDRILQYELELEALIGESGVIPTDPEKRDQCKEIAMLTRAAQEQYELLVSGSPSPMLTTLDSLGSNK
mmetsp:Transcript_48169/g.96988  ORF Transcript_48169/g.96988 Transcript_48169/m.96988 type:complete len:145 (-) Transcript_48169:197-631(-)